MQKFNGFYKKVTGNEGSKCRYRTRLDTYGCGCQHNCNYCYAKSLLSFRNLWNSEEPKVSDIAKIEKTVKKISHNEILRLGGMTDCFQPCEAVYRNTYKTIELLNKYNISYLIVTKSDMVAMPEYLTLMRKDLAHIQVTLTTLNDSIAINYEKASLPSQRIKAIEALYENGFDVQIRLSPFIEGFVNYDQLNRIKCSKILVEFLRVNHWIKQWFDIDYSNFTVKENGYLHLPLEKKIEMIKLIDNSKEISVCEDCSEHYEYWKKNFNPNYYDCCNLKF